MSTHTMPAKPAGTRSSSIRVMVAAYRELKPASWVMLIP